MGIPNIFLLAQACVFLVVFVVSFFVCVPSGINVSDFNGHCLLYASGKWQMKPKGAELTEIDWGPPSACNFTIFIGVISLILSFFFLVWTSVLLIRQIESSWLDAFITLVVTTVLCICIFSTALTVSVGFRDWCQMLTDPASGIHECEEGQYIPIGEDLHIHMGSYYVQWQVTQFGVWCCWISWLILSVMSLVRMYRYHRREAFMTSVNRERQRLLSRIGSPTETA